MLTGLFPARQITPDHQDLSFVFEEGIDLPPSPWPRFFILPPNEAG